MSRRLNFHRFSCGLRRLVHISPMFKIILVPTECVHIENNNRKKQTLEIDNLIVGCTANDISSGGKNSKFAKTQLRLFDTVSDSWLTARSETNCCFELQLFCVLMWCARYIQLRNRHCISHCFAFAFALLCLSQSSKTAWSLLYFMYITYNLQLCAQCSLLHGTQR